MTDTTTRFYKIVEGSGSGGLMCPPGHYNHKYSLWEYSGPRGRNEIGIFGLDYIDNEHAYPSDAIRNQVQRIKAATELVESEKWIRQVYGYYRNMYVPESGSRNAADLISYSRAELAHAVARKVLNEWFKVVPEGKDPKNYRSGVTAFSKRRGFEITAKSDGSRVYVYALADDGTRYSADHLSEYAESLAPDFDNVEIQRAEGDRIADRVVADMRIVPEPMDPERHGAVACIRQFFPEHQPRLDLIENPGHGYGNWPCVKCGEKVLYEAKFDAHAIVQTRIVPGEGTKWTYITECSEGGSHEVD